MPAAKHVVVILRRAPEHPRTAQALRSAVGYLTANLRVTLVLGGPAEALLPPGAAPSPALPAIDRPLDRPLDRHPDRHLDRHLRTLQALGQRVVLASSIDLATLVAAADAVVAW